MKLIKEKEQKNKEKEYIKKFEKYKNDIEKILNELLSKIYSNKQLYQNKIKEIDNNINFEKKYCDNDFKDLKLISIGGYGKVYSAYSIKDKKEICLKKINVDEMKLNYEKNEYEKNSYLNDLNNEIEILENLSWNKNSLKSYGSYDTSNEKVLIVEKCDGNLEQYIKKRKCSLTIKEIKKIFIDFNEILFILQMKKIIHRDLKLANLLVKYENKEKDEFIIKLSDYGISKFNKESNIKISGYKGSIDTVAPEIILQKIEKYESSSDIFSLGIILYQLSHNLKHPFIKNKIEHILIYNEHYDKDDYKIEFDDKSIENNLDFKDLIIKMLKLNPKNRISWDDYFEHKFFQK